VASIALVPAASHLARKNVCLVNIDKVGMLARFNFFGSFKFLTTKVITTAATKILKEPFF
jgi:hypothetical protein